jgi:hypothetical protein
MKIHNVRLGFATNSSSTHSIIFCENPPPDDDVEEDYFGWEQFTASSESIKGEYLARQLYINLLSFVSTDIAESVIKDWCSNISRGVGLSASGVDHQSVFNLPQDYDCNGTSKAFFKELSAYIMKDGIVILGGNDNADEKHPLLYANAEIVLPIGRDDDPRPLICRKDSQGYWSIFNKHTGVKVRFSFDDLAHTPLKSSVPELVDLKITDFCSKHPHPIQDTDWNGSPKVKAGIPIYKLDDAGNPIMGLGGGGECDYCYQGSSPQGKHGNTKYISSVLYNLAQAEVFEISLSGGEPTQHPDFCNIIETAHGYGIVPNFTTKSLLWLKTSWAKKVLEECGGFAYSVTNHKQIEHFKAVMDKFGYPGGKYYKRLQVHIVLGTVSRTEFKKMLITASNCHVGVTLLGYKTTGRGCEVKPIAYGWWLAIVKEVRESRYIRVGIDTVIAQDFERELSLSNIPDLLYHKQEGKFSCYIDAVTQEIAPSSFALRGEFKPLAPHGKWVETYQSF